MIGILLAVFLVDSAKAEPIPRDCNLLHWFLKGANSDTIDNVLEQAADNGANVYKTLEGEELDKFKDALVQSQQVPRCWS